MTTFDPKGRPASRAFETYTHLMRAAGSASARLHRGALARSGLTESQVGVLEALRQGPLTQREIGRLLLKSSGNVTLVVDNLEKRTLVRRERNPKDRRSVLVYLTSDGHRLIEMILPTLMAEVAAEMGSLTAAEQEELGRLCRKLERGE